MKKAFCMRDCLAVEDPCFWLNLVKQGKYKEAWLEIMKVNPLPAVCGYVCPHPCESSCKRILLDEPIAINNIEKFLGEKALANAWLPPVLKGDTKPQRIAVVGSGPSGLSCAYQLARIKYGVTIYESLPVLGGMLRVGIPEFRLPKSVLTKEINNILDFGVGFQEAILVDHDFLENLKKNYDAVFLAVGLQKSRKLNIPGEDGPAVLYGLDFLKEVNFGGRVNLGKKVVVIGGGNTAIDVARAARKTGSDVYIFYRRTRNEMPAITSEVEEAVKEGIKIQELAMPVGIGGGLLECKRVKAGGFAPIEGSNFKEEFDSLIVAIGEEKDKSLKIPESEKVFVSQDAGTVAAAIKAGREAAERIDIFLQKKIVFRNEKEYLVICEGPEFYTTTKTRRKSAKSEAKRCLGCGFEITGKGKVAVDAERCKGCGLCADICPYQVLEMGSHFNSQGYHPAFAMYPDLCRACGLCVLMCPDAAIEIWRSEDGKENPAQGK